MHSAPKTVIKGLMIDLSGTVHVGSTLLPGVQAAIHKLKERKIPLKYVTNTSKESKASLHRKLVGAGLEVAESDLFTSLSAARSYVAGRSDLRPLLLMEDEAQQDFAGLETENPNCVVVGLAPSHFHYERINAAFRLLQDGGHLVAINKSRYYKREDGLAVGTGAFVAALEFSADVQAHVVGKPEKEFFLLAQAELGPGVGPAETLMVGDDVRDDVLGAQAAGLQGALVRTGKYRAGDESRFGQPDYVFDSLEAVADFVISQLES